MECPLLVTTLAYIAHRAQHLHVAAMKDGAMFEFTVTEVVAYDSIKSWGAHAFKAQPEVGHYVELMDASGKEQMYAVLAIVHSNQPTKYAGELLIRHIGDHMAMYRRSIRGEG